MDQQTKEVLTDNQVYLGVAPEDLKVFEFYKNPDAVPEKGFYTDFSGTRTRLSYFGLDEHPNETQIGRVPFPDDGLHAETIEYIAALHAVESAGDSFTVVELGAGYGPWVVFGARAAARKGIQKIHMIAVEADRQRLALMHSNLSDNGLPVPNEKGHGGDASTSIEVVHGAISDENGVTSFGAQSIHDWGAAAIENGSDIDYRGVKVVTEQVNTYTIESVLKDVQSVDFMHLDIQGFEYRAVRKSLDALQRKVRVLLIATHSRRIEGELIGLLYDNGWRLTYEKPCKFALANGGDLTALTYLDGTQVWINTALGSPAQTTEDPADILSAANSEIKELKSTLHSCQREIVNLKSSTSWRVTAPLRKLKLLIS
ncbi:hypothetical protein UB43_15640 [Pseudomonas sp. 21]|uniref:FkbM family methyltransferase n=1 Tax=unclassified Pseudomonas TaxID=196821 RepID=UPI0005EAD82B|nr:MULTISPECIES: FkbM family methyltransferase [unclassified Pseudomonas]KJJ98121.1 hypothetical protein UB43_15640 [Pseudomonas sp. 21]MBV7583855.1 FkbM family methyltransferase [Pseudomonas sp. PDM33]